MEIEIEKQFAGLAKLITENAERSDAKFDQLVNRIDALGEGANARFEELSQVIQKTNGRVEELTLEVRDLRKTLLTTNDKIDILHAEVTGNLIHESKRITSLENRVDILEQKPH